jgi:hypothetical protein
MSHFEAPKKHENEKRYERITCTSYKNRIKTRKKSQHSFIFVGATVTLRSTVILKKEKGQSRDKGHIVVIRCYLSSNHIFRKIL